MESSRPITEADLRETEAQIARSYRRLRRSVEQAPSRALGQAGAAVREHPLAAAGAAALAGVALYGLFRLVVPRGGPSAGREQRPGPDLRMELLKMVLPLVTPYISGYLERYVAQVFSVDRR